MKIFGIGLNKTGTTTLRDCLCRLGYRVKGFDQRLTACIPTREFAPIFDESDRYDAFQDFPWPLIYRELDERYPGSRFILTRRANSSVWYESLKKHAYKSGPHRHRRIAYGKQMPHFHRKRYVNVYDKHNDDVRAYFAERPENFLELCWEEGDGWKQLCDFLAVTAPEEPLPHANASTTASDRLLRQTRTNLRSAIALLRNA